MRHARVHAFMSACVRARRSIAEAPEHRAHCRWTKVGISGKFGAALLLTLLQPRRVQPLQMRTAWPVPFYAHTHTHTHNIHRHRHTHTLTHTFTQHTHTQQRCSTRQHPPQARAGCRKSFPRLRTWMRELSGMSETHAGTIRTRVRGRWITLSSRMSRCVCSCVCVHYEYVCAR